MGIIRSKHDYLTRIADCSKVLTAVIESSGRANPKVNETLEYAGKVCKAAVPISVGLSLLSVTILPDWQVELAEQISSWSRAIILRSFTVETGRFYSPAGAVLGGIVGTIVATILDSNRFPDLVDWFYGGSSRSLASHILSDAYTPTREAAMKIMKGSGRGYYVHRVHKHDLVAIDQDPSRAAEVADAIVSRSGSVEQGSMMRYTAILKKIFPYY